MNPSRELDALIAEKVMGWERVGKNWHTKPEHRPSKDYPGKIINNWDSKGPHNVLISPDGKSKVYFCGCEDEGETIPYFSTDIAAAWQVFEKFPAFAIHTLDGLWYVRNANGFYSDVYSAAPTAPHAICLAALKAVSP